MVLLGFRSNSESVWRKQLGSPKNIYYIFRKEFQYLNPKGVMVAIIVVSTYVELGENYINYATQVVLLAFLFSSTSITLWTFIGKFLRKFATNDKFIKLFNYVMSGLLLLSIITFYI